MTRSNVKSFEDLLREGGLGWMLDLPGQKREITASLRKALTRADTHAQERFGPGGPRLTPEVMQSEFQINPHKVSAFLQLLYLTHSADMLVMSWQILQGWEIAEITLEYKIKRTVSFRVRLRSPNLSDKRDDKYESDDIFDVAVLQRFGITKFSDRPVFEGIRVTQ